LSAFAGDQRADLWPYVWWLRYAAATVVTLTLVLQDHHPWQSLGTALIIMGCSGAVQRLADRDDRWGVAILVGDCLCLAVGALLVPSYFPLCIGILIGSLALLSAVDGERSLMIGLLVSAPLLIATVAFRDPPLGVSMLLVVVPAGFSLAITSRHRERNLQRVHAEFHELIDSMDVAFWIAYGDDDVPHTIIGNLGKPVGRCNEFYSQPGSWIGAVHPDDRPAVRSGDAAVRAGHDHVTRYRELHVDGSYRWLEDAIHAEMNDDGVLLGTRGIRRDVTALVEAQEITKQFSHFVDALEDCVMIGRVETDSGITLLACNAAMHRLFADQLHALVGTNVRGAFASIFAGTPSEPAIARIRELFDAGQADTIQVDFHPPNGEIRTFNVSLVPLTPETLALVLVDVTSELATRRALARRASTDELTGLVNRVEFHDRLRRSLAIEGGGPVTVLLLDLDQFKQINDSFGHGRGDELLVAVTQRMQAQLPAGATLARLGGDEFAVVLAVGETTAEAVALAHRLTAAFNDGVVLDDLMLHVGASIGIASAPEHADALEPLIARADVAMYLAKARGGGHAIYDPALDTSSARRVVLLGDLRRALAMGEIVCHFQPIADREGRIVTAEALVRWQHPELGLIMPVEFIDLAEGTNLSEPLAMTVLRNALRQHELLHAVGFDIGLSINLSPGNLMNLTFVDDFCRLIADANLPRGSLTAEITERMLSGRTATMVPSLERLRDLGVRIALDDFGAGQTSLALLRSLPLDQLKIDKVLVDDIASGSEAVVRAIVDLAHQLGLEVVAEGVETAEVWDRLVALGCDRIQGHHVSRAITGGRLLQLLQSHV
jgi:diguanylate cyclase (GGDEF)-like protein